MYSTSPFIYTSISLLCLTLDAQGNAPLSFCIHPSSPALLLAKLYPPILQSLLGNEEALARQNARSDRVCLELFCNFFLFKRKKLDDNYM